MSIKATSLVWERSRMKGSALLMLLAIADYANDTGRGAFPSATTLARKSRMTPRAVYQILAALEANGEIAVEHFESKTTQGQHRRYLHLRCVYDWANYETEADDTSEDLAAAKFAEGVNPLTSDDGTLPLQTFPSAFSSPLKVDAHPLCKKEGGGSEKQGVYIDPSLDPLSDPKYRSLVSHPPVEPVENPHVRVLIKLAHAILDTQGGMLNIPATVDELKTRAALAHLAYDTESAQKAVAAALFQRKDR